MIEKVFARKKGENGLSIAIPYIDSTFGKNNIEENFLAQCYIPILSKKLEIKVNGEIFNSEKIVNENISKKVNIMKRCMESKENEINAEISKDNWTQSRLPSDLLDKIKEINKSESDFLFQLNLKIELPQRTSGEMRIFMEKDMSRTSNEKVDFWRDHLLITNGNRRKLPRGFNAIALIREDSLASILRGLEDPGHVTWVTGTIPDDIKKKYGKKEDIKKLVRYIKNLPHELATNIGRQPKNLNVNFFSNYFPRAASTRGEPTKRGEGGKENDPEPGTTSAEPQFQDFNYRSKPQGDGFCLTLKDRKTYPKNVTVIMAYGTGIGDAFKHYDINDFTLKENIKIDSQGCNILKQEDNLLQCEILSKDFKICFAGFDPNRELKIEIRDEK